MQGDEAAVGEHRQVNAGIEPAFEMGDVGVLTGGVYHQNQPIVAAGDDQVVEDAAVLVGELGVAHGPGREARDIPWHQALKCLGGAVAGEPQLAHVRDVEEAGGGPRVGVLRHDAGRIAHRHGVAGEGHQRGAEGTVLDEERRSGEGVGAGVVAHGISQANKGVRQRSRAGSSGAPSVSEPERLTARQMVCRGLTPSVRRPGVRRLLSRVASSRGP